MPSVETVEKFARALQVPLYQLFYEGDEPHKLRRLPTTTKPSEPSEQLWGTADKEVRQLSRLCHFLARMTERRRRLLLALAQGMAKSARRTRS